MKMREIGIARYGEMKERTMRIGCGEQRVAPDEPQVWFTSPEALAKVLATGNRELVRIIAATVPGSLDELSRATGRAKSNP